MYRIIHPKTYIRYIFGKGVVCLDNPSVNMTLHAYARLSDVLISAYVDSSEGLSI